MANTTWSATDKTAGITLSGTNNLIATSTGSVNQSVRTIDRQVSGKWYFEYTWTNTSLVAPGIANQLFAIGSGVSVAVGTTNIVIVLVGGGVQINGATSGFNVGAFSTNGIVGIAIDLNNSLMWIRNGAAGNWNGSVAANPATGAGGASIPGFGRGFPVYGFMMGQNSTTGAITANFGDTAFAGTAPAGFTGGFTSGASIPTNEIVTQVAVEQWQVPGSPDLQLTQAAVEQWQVPIPAVQLTQIGLEHWATGTPAVQLTQVALEQWATVNTSSIQVVVTQIGLEHWASVAGAGLTLHPDFIASSEFVYPPTLRGASILHPDFIPSGEVVYPPAVSLSVLHLFPDFIASSEIVYAPQVGPPTIHAAFIGSSEFLFAPTLIGAGLTVHPGFIDSDERIYPPAFMLGAAHVPMGSFSALFNVPPGRVRC